MKFKEFKTKIRKKIGLVGVAEFVDDPIDSNSEISWNSMFSNKKFLKNYILPIRLSFFKELVSVLKKSQCIKPDASLIDMGCGTGHLLFEFQKQYLNLKITGSDFSEEAIHLAKELIPQADFLLIDLYSIPKNHFGKFDVVVCTEVLEHLLYPEKALQNLVNLLNNKHGVLILSVPNGRKDTYENHINFWSPESWKVFVENNTSEAKDIKYHLIEKGMTNLVIVKY
jgi:2-polyprenyl-3-methyl-5-hydroxy-6-metoxy-1,4-benzoquinol methylase